VTGELSTSLPVRFTPEDRALCTSWLGGSGGPRYGLDVVPSYCWLPTQIFFDNGPGTHWIGGLVGPRDVLDAVIYYVEIHNDDPQYFLLCMELTMAHEVD